MKVKSSLAMMGEKSTNTVDEYSLAKKLALIVISDFMCWVRDVIQQSILAAISTISVNVMTKHNAINRYN